MKWAVFIQWIVLHYNTYKSEHRKMEKPHQPSCSGQDVLVLRRAGLRQAFGTPVHKRQQWICLCTQVLNTCENYLLSYATAVALDWWKSDGKIDWKNHFSFKLIFNFLKNVWCSQRIVLTMLFSSLSFVIQGEDEELHHNNMATIAEKNWAKCLCPVVSSVL